MKFEIEYKNTDIVEQINRCKRTISNHQFLISKFTESTLNSERLKIIQKNEDEIEKLSFDEYDYIDVDFIPSFTTEYYDDKAYLVCENIEWNKLDFTDEQNAIIEKYIMNNYENLDKQLCDSWLGF